MACPGGEGLGEFRLVEEHPEQVIIGSGPVHDNVLELPVEDVAELLLGIALGDTAEVLPLGGCLNLLLTCPPSSRSSHSDPPPDAVRTEQVPSELSPVRRTGGDGIDRRSPPTNAYGMHWLVRDGRIEVLSRVWIRT
jgi:hypothetical protein